MSELPLTVSTHPDDHAALLSALENAMSGTGPALAPMPVDEADALRTVEAVRPDQPVAEPSDGRRIALIVPTSGSSGKPKAALLSASALIASGTSAHQRLGGEGQWLLALPTTHVAGLQVVIRSLLAGLPPAVLDTTGGFDPADLPRAVASMRGRRRYLSLVPTQLTKVLTAGGAPVEALASMDGLVLGGAAAPAPLLAAARAAGIPVVPSYGMTETCGGCVYDGVPLPQVTVDLFTDPTGAKSADSSPAEVAAGVVDSGEMKPADVSGAGRIRIGGPVLFSGYRLRPDLTDEVLVGGRFRTADRGQWTDDGRLEIHGRVDDMIITGGVNVAPAAVESALASCPTVAESAVVGVSDERWGQRVVAVLTARPGLSEPTLESVRAHVGGLLGRASAPRAILVVPDLPRLPLGKVDRAAIAVLAARAPTAAN